MAVVMRLWGKPDGSTTPYDGQWLHEMDFEAYDGQGELGLTIMLGRAKQFPDMEAALKFYQTSPRCKPLRSDGQPNRPLTSTNWEFQNVDE